MGKLLSLLLIFSLNAPAFALNSTTRELQADFLTGIRSVRNFVKNYGAEQGINDVTGTNVTVTRNTTNPIEGTGDFSFTIDSATDVVTWATNTFDNKLSGQTCEAKLRYTADANASNVKFQVYQGASLIASQALQNSTTPRAATITFSCGDLSTATTLKIVGTAATATALKVDSVQVNESEPIFVTNASRLISQTAHGFSVGQVLYYTGSTYALAKADADATSEVVGVVSGVIDADSFRLLSVGFVTGLSGLVTGSTYYLSDTSAGALTATAPTVGPSVNKPVLVAVSTTTGYVLQSRGYVIGPASTQALVMSDWIAYTPTFTNFGGTPTSISAFYRRVGQDIEIRMNFTLSGTPSGTNTITLPSGLLVDSTKVPSGYSLFGKVTNSSVNTTWSSGVIAQGSASVFSLAREASSGGITPTSNSGDIGNTGQTLSLFASIPIAGWTATSSGQVSAPRSEITVDTGNGHGSTNTKMRRFSNTRKNIGSAITYADSATLGATFTINETGIYSISYQDKYSLGAFDIGISINDSATTTNVFQTTYAQGRRIFNSGGSNTTSAVAWTGNLSVGDIVYAKDDGTCDVTNDNAMFTITKVSN